MLGHAVAFSGVVPGGAGDDAMTPPDFGRSVNPISSKKGGHCEFLEYRKTEKSVWRI